MPITYKKGDATNPLIEPDRNGLIIHIANTRGGWGKGFVLAVSKRWPEPEAAYRQWFAQKYWDEQPFELGKIQAVKVEPNLHVCNMIAQEGYGLNNQALHQTGEPNGTPPIRYIALSECLTRVAVLAKSLGASVHGPRFGSGLSGGSWPRIEEIINRVLADVPVYIYEL